MKRVILTLVLLLLCTFMTGCATSQHVTLAQLSTSKKVVTVALAPQDGNSSAMDENIQAALMTQGITPHTALASGTRKSEAVDAIVSYSDVWRWDLVMYLKSITINLFDANSGNLLVTANWENSPFHGFQDPKKITTDLVSEIFSKLNTNKSQ